MTETIVAAALRKDELIFSIPPPARHHTIFWAMAPLYIEPINFDQGFVTSTGRFVARNEACSIAREAKQILIKTGPEYELFSEDVW
jgi:hypothetical protein